MILLFQLNVNRMIIVKNYDFMNKLINIPVFLKIIIMKKIIDSIKLMINYAIERRISFEYDIEYKLRKIANDTTIDYIQNKMRDVLILQTTWTGLADYVIPEIKRDGLFLEFGVWR